MKLPAQVLEVTAEGCGTSLNALRSSPRYDALMAQQSAPRADPLTALAQRVSPLELGALMNPFGGRERSILRLGRELPDFSYDADSRALISLLGAAIIERAKACLPDVCRDMAAEWRTATSTRQRRIFYRLRRMLCGGDVKSMYSDMLDQPRERVLPAFYGQWTRTGKKYGEKSRANCLGKAQMCAAFVSLCGTEAIDVVPLRSAHEHADMVRGNLGTLLAPHVEGTEIPLFMAQMAYLRWYEALGQSERERPSFPHHAVAARLRSGRWVMIDPNFNSSAGLPVDLETRKIAAMIRRLGDTAPGITFLTRTERTDRILGYCDVETVHKTIVDYLAEVDSLKPRGEEAVEFLAKSQLQKYLRMLSSRLVRRLNKKTRDELTGGKPTLDDIQVARYMLLTSFFLDDKEKNGEESERIMRAGETLNYLEGEKMDVALRRLPVHIITSLTDEFNHRTKDRRLFPPECQLGNLEHQLAVHTLMHVGIDLGLSDETASALGAHCFEQYNLHNSATALQRFPERWSRVNPLARRAADILTALPYRLRSATHLLEMLKGPTDGQATEAA